MPHPDDDFYEFEETFRQLFRKVKSSWSKFEDQGVTASQAVILEKLECDGPLKVSQLADMLWITSGAITSLADKLIAGGFAERARSEADRRVVYLRVTEKGREILASLRAHRKKVVESYFGKLSKEDVQHLSRIFNQILKDTD